MKDLDRKSDALISLIRSLHAFSGKGLGSNYLIVTTQLVSTAIIEGRQLTVYK